MLKASFDTDLWTDFTFGTSAIVGNVLSSAASISEEGNKISWDYNK